MVWLLFPLTEKIPIAIFCPGFVWLLFVRELDLVTVGRACARLLDVI